MALQASEPGFQPLPQAMLSRVEGFVFASACNRARVHLEAGSQAPFASNFGAKYRETLTNWRNWSNLKRTTSEVHVRSVFLENRVDMPS